MGALAAKVHAVGGRLDLEMPPVLERHAPPRARCSDGSKLIFGARMAGEPELVEAPIDAAACQCALLSAGDRPVNVGGSGFVRT